MGYGMCGARSFTQTPAQALDAVADALPQLRLFFNAGSGPNGGSIEDRSRHGPKCKTSTGELSQTPGQVGDQLHSVLPSYAWYILSIYLGVVQR